MTSIKDVKIRLGISEQAVQTSWSRLQKALCKEAAEIKARREEVIPEIHYDEIAANGGQFPDWARDAVHKRGVIVVRETFSEEEAGRMFRELKEYLAGNRALDQSAKRLSHMYNVYWSRTQVEARQHPRMLAVQRALMGLWSLGHVTLDSQVDLSEMLMYIDRFRIRRPGSESRLPPHVDGGSINRWIDPIYTRCYSHIYAGDWEKYDPFVVNGRGVADFGSGNSFFRAFQGWTALTGSGSGDGTLRVMPALKESTAYLLLRPLLPSVTTREMPGCDWGQFRPSAEWHAELFDAMVPVPKVRPGDSVWWHPDMLHSVEDSHCGQYDNAVMYIPVGPECPKNRLYVERMKFHFAKGIAPPDFPNRAEKERRFDNRASVSDLSEEGRKMMGFKN